MHLKINFWWIFKIFANCCFFSGLLYGFIHIEIDCAIFLFLLKFSERKDVNTENRRNRNNTKKKKIKGEKNWNKTKKVKEKIQVGILKK